MSLRVAICACAVWLLDVNFRDIFTILYSNNSIPGRELYNTYRVELDTFGKIARNMTRLSKFRWCSGEMFSLWKCSIAGAVCEV